MKKKPIKKKSSKKASLVKTVVTKPSRRKAPTKSANGKKSTSKKDQSLLLLEAVVEGIQEKKGENVVSLNLKKIDSSICNYFVICDANSRTQVDAIARSVEEIVRKQTGQKPYHSEGHENAEWILIDYVDVVVHLFQKEIRTFYRLEDLWADAEIKQYT